MSKDILGAAVRALVSVPEDRLGLVIDFAFKATSGDTDWVTRAKAFLRGKEVGIMQPNFTPSLLELVSTVVVPTTTGTFVAKKKFVINIQSDAPVKISYLGDNFMAWFLSGDGKIEDPITQQLLRYHKLRKSSVDGPIITELGGEAKAETSLSVMFSIMEKQKYGEDGVLLNNFWANIFYIKDCAGVLRTVFVRWSGVGWDVNAYSVEDSDGWYVGRQVFSRNSALEPMEPSAPAQVLSEASAT